MLVEYFKSILIYIYKNKQMYYFYTLAEGILNSVRSLQRSEEDVSDPIKYIYS